MKKKVFTKTMTVTIEEAVFETIKNITDKEEISISEWIREAISRRLEQENINLNSINMDRNQSVQS